MFDVSRHIKAPRPVAKLPLVVSPPLLVEIARVRQYCTSRGSLKAEAKVLQADEIWSRLRLGT